MPKPIALMVVMVAVGCRGAEALDTDERDAFDRGGESQLAVQAALGLSDDLFQFDPTLDAAKTAIENAAAVRANAAGQLGTCGSATLNAATVTVSFGAAPGCTLANGAQVSGTVTLALAKAADTTTVAVTFTQVVVDGTELSGSASFATTNGTTFTTTFNLISKGATVTGTVMVIGSPTRMTIDGTVAQLKTGAPTNLIKIMRGLITQTITFTSTTASIGDVQVKVGNKTSTVYLPHYGQCPSAAY